MKRWKSDAAKAPGKFVREAWQNSAGEIVKYNLAFINHFACKLDNGRVLGYDVSHGHHHRHSMGKVEAYRFVSYAELSSRFFQEVWEICEKIKKGDRRWN